MKTKIKILVISLLILFPFLSRAGTISAYNFTWPLDRWAFDIDGQKFGSYRGSGIYHLGDDVTMPAGSPVYSIATGIVKHVGLATDFGTVILIEHALPSGEKIVSLYGHLSPKTNVPAGQFVNKNQIIGFIGTTAENGGWPEHLHFGIRKGAYVDVNKTWVYWGLGSQELLNDWYNPTEFLLNKINNPDLSLGKIITAPNAPGRSQIRMFGSNNQAFTAFDFFAYSPKNKSGFQITMGNVNKNNAQELIVSSNYYGSKIKVFNKKTQDLISQFQPFAKKYKGQINLAIADLNRDGQDEIITSTSANQFPKIKVFSFNQASKKFEESIKIPIPFSQKIKCGINISAIDLDNNNQKEIIATPASKIKSTLKYWNGQSWQILKKRIFKKTNATLASGDIDGDKNPEIIAGSSTGSRSQIKIIDQFGRINKNIIKPFTSKYQKGINVSTTDLNNDGIDEIITSLAKSAPPKVKVIQYKQNLVLESFLAYNKNFYGGVNIVGVK